MKKLMKIYVFLLAAFLSLNTVFADTPTAQPPCATCTAADWVLTDMTVSSSICSGCDIIITYAYSLICREYYIVGYTFSTSQCADCINAGVWTNADIFKEMEAAILKKGVLVPSLGGMTTTKVSQGACWERKSNPLQPGGYSPCDNGACCRKEYLVSVSIGGVITYTLLSSVATPPYCTSPCFDVCNPGFFPKISFEEETKNDDNPIVKSASYPDPSNGIAEIRFTTELKGKVLFKLFDLSGKEVLKIESLKNTEEGVLELNLTELNMGFYLYQITIDEKIISTGKLTLSE